MIGSELMKYFVKLDGGEDYIVDIESPDLQRNVSASELKKDNNNAGNVSRADECMLNDYSKEISYEAVKLEYEHCIQRSEKLDNKIYIMLTVYAFIFTLLTSSINQIRDFVFPTDTAQLAMIILFFFQPLLFIYSYTLYH
ncbi:MAG: hypothetical protein LUF27_04525 [Lachnospiraceae bacterium]|nr:hypothetical protein [Lachnospiraceae bacterium]